MLSSSTSRYSVTNRHPVNVDDEYDNARLKLTKVLNVLHSYAAVEHSHAPTINKMITQYEQLMAEVNKHSRPGMTKLDDCDVLLAAYDALVLHDVAALTHFENVVTYGINDAPVSSNSAENKSLYRVDRIAERGPNSPLKTIMYTILGLLSAAASVFAAMMTSGISLKAEVAAAVTLGSIETVAAAGFAVGFFYKAVSAYRGPLRTIHPQAETVLDLMKENNVLDVLSSPGLKLTP